jgi:hypothetical protein
MLETITVVGLITLGAFLLGGIVYAEVMAHYERRREDRYAREWLKRQDRK